MRIEIEDIPNTDTAQVTIIDDERTIRFVANNLCAEMYPEPRKASEMPRSFLATLTAPPATFRVNADIVAESFTCTHALMTE